MGKMGTYLLHHNTDSIFTNSCFQTWNLAVKFDKMKKEHLISTLLVLYISQIQSFPDRLTETSFTQQNHARVVLQ